MKINAAAIFLSAILLSQARGEGEGKTSHEKDAVAYVSFNTTSHLRGDPSTGDRRLGFEYFTDYCYKTGYYGNILCEDFCGPGRHFWYSPVLDKCHLSSSKQYRFSINDCKAFRNSYCNMNEDDYYETQKRICKYHCSKGIAAAGGGMQNCKKTTTAYKGVSGWWCNYWKEPYFDGRDSHVSLICPTLPEYEPDENCACRIQLQKSTDEYDASRTCSECNVGDDKNNDPRDTNWSIDYNCDNIDGETTSSKSCRGTPTSCSDAGDGCKVEGCSLYSCRPIGKLNPLSAMTTLCAGTPQGCSEFKEESSCKEQGCTWS